MLFMGVLFVSEDGIERGEADGTADEQGRYTQPRLQFWQHGDREPRRSGDEAGEGCGGLVRVHC